MFELVYKHRQSRDQHRCEGQGRCNKMSIAAEEIFVALLELRNLSCAEAFPLRLGR